MENFVFCALFIEHYGSVFNHMIIGICDPKKILSMAPSKSWNYTEIFKWILFIRILWVKKTEKQELPMNDAQVHLQVDLKIPPTKVFFLLKQHSDFSTIFWVHLYFMISHTRLCNWRWHYWHGWGYCSYFSLLVYSMLNCV